MFGKSLRDLHPDFLDRINNSQTVNHQAIIKAGKTVSSILYSLGTLVNPAE